MIFLNSTGPKNGAMSAGMVVALAIVIFTAIGMAYAAFQLFNTKLELLTLEENNGILIAKKHDTTLATDLTVYFKISESLGYIPPKNPETGSRFI